MAKVNRTLKVVDDHNNKERELIGLWVNERGQVAAAIDAPMYCLNKVYTDSEGTLHLSRESIGGVYDHGEIKDQMSKWTLIEF